MAEDFSQQEEAARNAAAGAETLAQALAKSSIETELIRDNLQSIGERLSSTASAGGDMSNIFRNAKDTVKGLSSEAGRLSEVTKETLSSEQKTKKILERQSVVKGKLQQLNSQISILQARMVNATEEEAGNINDMLEDLYVARGESEKLVDQFDELGKANKEISKNTKWISDIGELVGKVPILSTVFNDFKKAAEEARKTLAEGDEFGAQMKGLGAAITSLGKILFGGVVSNVFKAVGRSQKRIKALTADLNITRGAALGVQSSFIKIAQSIPGMTADDLTKSVTEFSKALGFSVKPTAEIVKTFGVLTQKLGLSVDEATKLAKISTSTGMSFEQFSTSIAGYTKLQNSANGTAIRFQDIMKDISGAGAATALTTSQFEGGIRRAAFQARKLGLSFKTLETSSSSLLDFQSSIENQMNAELLIGRQLNGDRLRYAALTGNQADLAEEIARQAGTEAEFSRMNVIQQQALAEFLGMSRNELAEMFLEQKALTKFSSDEGKTLSEKVKARQKEIQRLKETGQLEKARRLENQLINDLGDTQLATQIKNQTIQERMAEAIVKMSDAFVDVDGPLGNINAGIERLNETLLKIVEFPQIFGGGLSKIFTKLIKLGKDIALGMGKTFLKAFSRVGTSLTDIFTKTLPGALESTKDLFKGFGKIVLSPFEEIPKFFKGLPKTLFEAGEKMMSSLGKGLVKAGKFGIKVLKKIPLIGTLIGLGYAYKRWQAGDYLGAGAEFLSAALTLIPGFGTAASIGVDAALIASDIKGYTGMDPEKRNLDASQAEMGIMAALSTMPLFGGLFGGTVGKGADFDLLQKRLDVTNLVSKVRQLEDAIDSLDIQKGDKNLTTAQRKELSSTQAKLTEQLLEEKRNLDKARQGLKEYNTPKAASNQVTPSSSVNTPTKMEVADFTIRSHPKDTLVMSGGTRFGEETNKLLERLIQAVEKGGSVYLDGRKVGESLVLSTVKQ